MRIFWTLACLGLLGASGALGAVYYVSSESGNDGNDGLTPGNAFETVTHVNSLALMPGDEVRLFCGETWKVQSLVITRSGSAGNPIVFSSHPAGCADKPVLSGAQPVAGWSLVGANLYMSDLDTGTNAGLFPLGLNQLFRGPMSRVMPMAATPKWTVNRPRIRSVTQLYRQEIGAARSCTSRGSAGTSSTALSKAIPARR